MQFDSNLIKEDIRKIGVALVVGSLLSGLLKDTDFFNIAYPFSLGVILIVIGSATNKEGRDE
jgi:hypothetical protein